MKMTAREKELASFILKTMKKYIDQKFESVIKENRVLQNQKNAQHTTQSSKLQQVQQKKLPTRLAKDPMLNEALQQTKGFDGTNTSKPIDRLPKALNRYKQQMDEAYSEFNSDFMYEEDVPVTAKQSNQKTISAPVEIETNEYDALFDSEPSSDEYLDASLNDISVLLSGKNMAEFAKKHPSKTMVKDENI